MSIEQWKNNLTWMRDVRHGLYVLGKGASNPWLDWQIDRLFAMSVTLLHYSVGGFAWNIIYILFEWEMSAFYILPYMVLWIPGVAVDNLILKEPVDLESLSQEEVQRSRGIAVRYSQTCVLVISLFAMTVLLL